MLRTPKHGAAQFRWEQNQTWLQLQPVLPEASEQESLAGGEPEKSLGEGRYFCAAFHFSTAASVLATWPLGSSAVYSKMISPLGAMT